MSFIAIALLASFVPFVIQNSLGETLTGIVIDENANFRETFSRYSIVFILASVVASIALALIISNAILRPISEIKEQVFMLQSGKKVKPVKVSGNNDISELAKVFNQLLHTQNSKNKDYLEEKNELRIIKKVKGIDD